MGGRLALALLFAIMSEPGPGKELNAAEDEPNLESIGAREVLDTLPDGAYITNAERKILFWSRAAERITGWPAAEVVGHRCADNILVHVDKDGHQLCTDDYCPLHRAMITGEPSRTALLVYAQHKDGTRIPVEVSVAPLRDRLGQTVGGIEVFRDLTSVMQDLRRAKVIQDYVLHSDLERDARVRFEVSYRPEELVGGDFYRVQRLSADVYAIMIADVMGHGIAAALYTMQMRTIWDECQEALDSPAAFLEVLNQRLRKLAGPDGYFATAVYLRLDLAKPELSYVRAGHPAPLLFPLAGHPRPLGGRSPALGLLEDPEFRLGQEKLQPGDRLLLFTDGAIEITNAAGDELGETGFVDLVRQLPEGSMDLGRIERKLLEYSNNIRLPDDLTLLAIELLPGSKLSA